MYVYCNFYCSSVKKNGSNPHFFWTGDATVHRFLAPSVSSLIHSGLGPGRASGHQNLLQIPMDGQLNEIIFMLACKDA